jgi:aminoglycoside phosphotransferase (APT) family kinase protein
MGGMLELTEHNAAEYLHEAGRVAADERLEVTFLAGGVSNVVLLVERLDRPGERFVLKQARGQLRVAEPWFCSIERIWREVAYLRACQTLLDPPPREGELVASTPAVLWEDRANYAFAMQAAPAEHTTWKTRLLAGDFDLRFARLAGKLLGQLHTRTWLEPAVAAEFADDQYFDDLRVDPYYRHLARVRPELKPAIGELIASLQANRCCLVHGDFSPKNLLAHAGGLMLIDCEVGHFGDPAFDLGFVLTHLVLKETLRDAGVLGGDLLQAPLPREFLGAYWDALDSILSAGEQRSLQARMHCNLGGCLLARLAGKSPVEYRDRLPMERVWEVGTALLAHA